MDLNTPSGSTKKPARISLSCKSQSLTEREEKVRHLPCSTCNPTFRCHSTCLLDLRELGEQVLRQGPAEDVEIRPDPPLPGSTGSSWPGGSAAIRPTSTPSRSEKLKDLNIFVRYFAQPGIDNYLRITIGTDEQMDKLISALSEDVYKRQVPLSVIWLT